MKRIILALGLAAALCSTAAAETAGAGAESYCTATFCGPKIRLVQFGEAGKQLPPGIEVPPVGAIGDPNQGKIGTPNVIINQAPAAAPAPATIDTGSIAGQVLVWVISAFGTVLAGGGTLLIRKLLQKAGIQVSQAASDKINDILLNGLAAGAAEAQKKLAGKGQIEIKNATLASAITYAQAHGAETLKVLGGDPSDPKTVEALRARAEKLIADPAAPTPKVLDASPPAEAAAAQEQPAGTGPRGQ